jgi:hypothetical protein
MSRGNAVPALGVAGNYALRRGADQGIRALEIHQVGSRRSVIAAAGDLTSGFAVTNPRFDV